MKNQFVLPNILTTFGLSCGLFVIFRMSMIAPGMVEMEHVRSSLLLILLAAFIDTLDGALARAMKVESDFGSFFDSMSDAIAFGVAPSVLVLKTMSPPSGSFVSLLLYVGVMVFSVAGVLRLVRFSTMSLAPQDPEKKTVFVGLPITISGIALTSLTVYVFSLEEAGQQVWPYCMSVAAFFIGYLMISRWRFPSLKALHRRYSSTQLVFFAAALAPVVLLLLLNNVVLTCMIFSWGYILFSWSRSLYYLARGRKELALIETDKGHDDM